MLDVAEYARDSYENDSNPYCPYFKYNGEFMSDTYRMVDLSWPSFSRCADVPSVDRRLKLDVRVLVVICHWCVDASPANHNASIDRGG